MSTYGWRELVDRIAELSRERLTPLLVAIDGRSGAGKSILAAAVIAELEAAVIDGDDFYSGGSAVKWDAMTPAERVDHCMDWRRQLAVLETLCRRQVLPIPGVRIWDVSRVVEVRLQGETPCLRSQRGRTRSFAGRVVSDRVSDHQMYGRPDVESISAVTLATHDMARSIGFYTSLGLELLYGGPDARFSSFAIGDGSSTS